MNRILTFSLISIFSIFLGSQITEGCLLIPYWKTLDASEFYEYYAHSGPLIGRFYTILTVVAAIIPILISIYCFSKKSRALKYSLISSLFTFSFVALFYIYFKDTNQQFYNIAFNPTQLKSELKAWEYWHWSRILFEFIAQIFLILTLNILTDKRLA